MDAEPQPPSHGAVRIQEHALLGDVASASVATFTFDGRAIEGYSGEPIAAALLAAGIRVFRTMPRFGDPRGGYCMVGRCTDCQVMVNGVPGVRACVTRVSAGLEVRSQSGLGDPGASEMPEPES